MSPVQAPIEIKSSLKVRLFFSPTSFYRWPKIIRYIEHSHQYWILDDSIDSLKMHIEHLECSLKHQLFSSSWKNSLSLLLPVLIGITPTPLDTDLIVVIKIIQLELLSEIFSCCYELSLEITALKALLAVCPSTISNTKCRYSIADCDCYNEVTTES